MNNDMIKKFESKERLEELSPVNTLKRAGFESHMSLCDIGAGTGIFSIPAAEISSNTIYALEKSDDMIEILNTRKTEKEIKNLIVKKVDSDIFPIEDGVCDLVLLVTVLHHIDDKKTLVHEIKRMLKSRGKLMVIEFHKIDNEVGPPVEIKMSQEELEGFARENDLKIIDKFVMGDNFYCYIFDF